MRRKDSSFIAFRKRVPADVVGKADGRSVVIRFPAEGSDPQHVVFATVGNAEVKFSLRTRDPAIAKSRSGVAEAHLQRLYASLRQGARQLTRREVTALAGEWYRAGMARWEDDPGSGGVWQKLQDAMAKAADDPAFLEAEMAPFVDELLAEKALIIDEQSRMALMQGMRRAIADAASTLQRRSEFDYGPDELAARYPVWEEASASTGTGQPKRPSTTPKDGKAVSMRGLVDSWWQEAQAAGLSRKTHQAYGSAMDRLRDHVGHDDASRITPEDVLGLKDARLGRIDIHLSQIMAPAR
ncbi:DUF6538 domain-containing protein [Ancylobacter defluvii]|uniref:DUF6538 domain-containing protein n=1 Tax=Ancylobacter defluvii TaxID=1282440 RepID=A0A9W6JTG9_9HYPH|nr:DUF6538 domain-containing protein [Ancylobacter defluvii]MBS7590539.1 hypothetical protein [Ancylobacter defluvii]GLK83461.1 hypothetical protein GCM10017653_15300 [Ancylobacter defluvii]